MVRDAVWLSVVERTSTPGACELCGTEPAPVAGVVVVRHAHGGMVEFVACDRCTRALRRVLAAVGGDGQVLVASSRAPDPPLPAVVTCAPKRSRHRVLHSEVILEFAEQLVAQDGTSYTARACGGPRSDGTWVGSLEFLAVGEERVRRTGQETTQPSREALAYWATGLEPVYLQGAFARSR